MRASSLRHKIVVQKYEVDNSNIEYPVKKWVTHCEVHADVQDLSTRDGLLSQQVGAYLVARAVVRYNSLTKSIKYDMRVLLDGVYYQVNGNPRHNLGDRREYLTIELKEGLREWQ